MKRPLCMFACSLIVFIVSVVEWGNWFRDLNRTPEGDLSPTDKTPLASIYISQKAGESHKLPLISEAAVVLDTRKAEVLFSKNMETELPIASLTKLMSALVFLDTNPDLNDIVTINSADVQFGGSSQLKVGEDLTLCDLLHASLMHSSNRATRVLARASGLSPSEFAVDMNLKAKQLGLENTFFYEPTGLNKKNRSTALDCAKLIYFALQDSVIASVLNKTTYEFVSQDKGKRRHQIGSTNGLLFSSLNVKGGKTGYNGASGWCLGTMVEGKDGEEMVAVILGAPTKRARFKEIRSIVKWSIEKNKKGG